MNFNKKGFLLAETLIVATFITSTLIFLFIQLRNITNDYDVTFKYNTIDGLYSANTIINYMNENAIVNDIVQQLNNEPYLNLGNCSFYYLYESDFCLVLLEKLNVKNIIITKNNPDQLIENLEQTRTFPETFINFIKYINFGDENYRIIVEFYNESYATLPINL